MTKHENNFGVLRLIFAALVIFGHAPEMIDGDQSREPLYMLTGTITLGSFAVAGFFLLSGYLITSSMLRSNDLRTYAISRILRIYPAFIVAYLLSVVVLGSLVGSQIMPQLLGTIVHLIFLQPPIDYPGQFPGMVHYPLLNGAMWTIAYEFRCYVLIAILWYFGVLQKKRAMLVLTALAILASIVASAALIHAKLNFLSDYGRPLWVTGNLYEGIKFTATFLFGSSIFLYRDRIIPHLSGLIAAICAVIGAALIIDHPHIAYASLIVFGGLVIFWVALKAPIGRLQRINDKWDISYGVYLYGWPIATYLRWIRPTITPVELALVTFALALIFGCASWWGIERWTKVSTVKAWRENVSTRITGNRSQL